MRTIAVVTFARSEYSNCRPVLRELAADPTIGLQLIVSGSHLVREHGNTVAAIEADGFAIAERVAMPMTADSPEAAAKALAAGLIAFADAFARHTPDVVLLFGDRLELLACASAAVAFGIPIAHAFGGDLTEGAIDNQVRHALTKLSHIHFVALADHKRRLLQMGEEESRIWVTGDPALDELDSFVPLPRSELERDLGFRLESPVIVVTYHPTTLASQTATEEVDQLLRAMADVDGTLIFTYPGLDVGHRAIVGRIEGFAGHQPRSHVLASLGQLRYYSLLACADLLVGNSSSALWEAPSFHLPAVNVGDRQAGRTRAANVIDVPCEAARIRAGVCTALSPEFRARLSAISNPYRSGVGARTIHAVLREIPLGPHVLVKRFVEL